MIAERAADLIRFEHLGDQDAEQDEHEDEPWAEACIHDQLEAGAGGEDEAEEEKPDWCNYTAHELQARDLNVLATARDNSSYF